MIDQKEYETKHMEHARKLGILDRILKNAKLNIRYSNDPIADVEMTCKIVRGKK